MQKQKLVPLVQLISKNSPKISAKDRLRAQTPKDAYHILRSDWDDNTINLLEEFKVMSLDRQMRLNAISTISKGGMAGTVVDLKILFATALLSKAQCIIIAHNHPSGTLKPSKQDIAITEKIKEAGDILDIPLKDHIIVTEDSYCSFNENDIFEFYNF